MKPFLLLTTFFFLLSTSFSQEQFNVHYVDGYIPNSRSVVVLADTGYATVGGASIDGNYKVAITIADLYGNLKETKHYGSLGWDYYHGLENNCFKSDSGNYFLSGSAFLTTDDVSNPIDSSYTYLLKMNEDFDSLKIYTFLHDTLSLGVSGMCPTTDKGFLIVGKTTRKSNGALVYENSFDAFMLKVDSLGQQEWHKTFGRNTSGHDQDNFHKVVQTPDGGYLCAGYTKSWQAQNFFDKGDWWLVKTNSLGVEQWSRRYGHPDFDDGRPYGLIMSSDTCYYIVGTNTLYQIGSNNVRNAHILKLDKYFNDVYERNYGGISRKNSFFSIIENNENDFVLTGYFQDAYELYSERATMYKLNADGDSIWKRQYTCTDTLEATNRASSIKQTSDNGYVFTGIAYDDDLSPAQQVWLVKTDQYGCDGTNWWTCATNIAVNQYVSNPSFLVYPNPAREQLTINIPAKAGIPSQTVEVYDLTGKLVKQIVRLSEDEASRGTVFSVDISNLEKGLYILKVGKETQKLVVE